jgi:hypothetical protein
MEGNMKEAQLEINFTGKELRDIGMKKAIDHADQVNERWSEKAYAHLIAFVNERNAGERFMIEDIRITANIPDPPSNKAWGAVAKRAMLNNVIRKIGIAPVNNARAHRANCNVYIKK